MVKTHHFLRLFILLWLSLWLGIPQMAQEDDDISLTLLPTLLSQDEQIVPIPQSPASIPLSLTGFNDSIMESPVDQLTYTFGLPADWQLESGATLQLNLTAFYDVDVELADSNQEEDAFSGLLRIEFNDQLIEVLPVDWVGERFVTIPILDDALVTERDDRRHRLTLIFESRFECGSNRQSGLVVSNESFFTFPYESVSPTLDLTTLPYPFQQQSFAPDAAWLVVPDDPSEEELTAAMLVAGGISNLTFNRVTLSLITISELTTEEREAANLIFVGQASKLPLLEAVESSLPWDDTGFDLPPDQPDDVGILQIATSPWNPGKAVLTVSGQSDEAVVKASKALTTGEFRTYETNTLALIQQVDRQPDPPQPVFPLITLGSLGYETVEFEDSQRSTFRFSIPNVDRIGANPSFNVVYNHSNLLDYERSGMNISLNDNPIGSIEFSTETVNSINLQQIDIPSIALTSGSNEITVETRLNSADPCANPNVDDNVPLWSTIYPDSFLNLPIDEASLLSESQRPSSVIYNLNDYRDIFARSADLDDLAFIVPDDDPLTWALAIRVAADMGQRALVTPLQFQTYFDGHEFTEEELETKRFVVIGSPRDLTFINELGDALLVPFLPGQNRIDERALPVAYSYTDAQSVGYIQLINSPWNPQLPLLLVGGNNKQGVVWAANTLATNLVFRLGGNFSTVNQEDVINYNLRRNVTNPNIPFVLSTPDSADADPEAVAAQLVSEPERPDWLLPLIVGSGVLLGLITLGVILIALFRFVSHLRSRSKKA